MSAGVQVQLQLPLEILPHILQFLQWRTRDLHACCLVSKTWNVYATPRLYSRLFLRDQKRLIKVLSTLQHYPRLARLLRILEIRVFPFGLPAEDLEKVEASLLDTLLQAVNLVELYWTRTGSLTDRVIPFLPILPSLETLELTGSSRFYTPANITKYLVSQEKTPNLKHFSILLPDRNVCEELPKWAQQLGFKLESISILCQHSALVSDDILKAMAPHLSGINRVSIAGAKAVTAEGVTSLIQKKAIEELAIEGLAVHLAAFVEDLPSLTEFTLYRSSWNTSRVGEDDLLDEDENGSLDEVVELSGSRGSDHNSHNPEQYRRQELEEHATTGRPIIRDPRLSISFLKRFLNARGPNLRKLRMHGILITMEQLRSICEECTQLQDLVVQLFEDDKLSLQVSISKLPQLVSLHILSPLYSVMFLSDEDLHQLAAQSSNTLRQLGFRNRVWLVARNMTTETNQTKVSQAISLQRWDMSAGTFPEVLLVVRA